MTHRLLLVLAASVSLAILPGCPNPGPCTPATCFEMGASCGQIDDGCGDTLECGGCPAGEGCVAGACQCVPKSCAAAGKNCGEIDDGCGGTVNCGTCTGTQVCGGTSPNVCGATPCTGKTCEELGVTCGRVSDGCGRFLSCDLCGAGMGCSGSTCVSCEGTSWTATARPWMQANCTRCHSWATSQTTVKAKQATIASRVRSGNMPDDATLSESERQVILTWIACGMP